jgi:beta-galactosidase beta subunit
LKVIFNGGSIKKYLEKLCQVIQNGQVLNIQKGKADKQRSKIFSNYQKK